MDNFTKIQYLKDYLQRETDSYEVLALIIDMQYNSSISCKKCGNPYIYNKHEIVVGSVPTRYSGWIELCPKCGNVTHRGINR